MYYGGLPWAEMFGLEVLPRSDCARDRPEPCKDRAKIRDKKFDD